MDRTTRYLFILLGFVVFLILAPLLILYLSGTRLNLSEGDTTATGILVAKSEPASAEVFLNGEDKDKTPATVRFLNRSDYSVRLMKDGYFPWTKKLSVEAGKVTYTYEGVDAVQMLRLPKPVAIPVSGVTSFVFVDDVIWFGTANSISSAPVDNPQKIIKTNLPITPKSITIVRSSAFLIAENENGKKVLIDRGNNNIFTLPDSFNVARDINITSNGFVLARIGDVIYSYNLSTHVSTPVMKQVMGFTLLDNIAYIAQKGTPFNLQTAEWSKTGFTNAAPILNSRLPNTADAQLIVTKNKELFVLAGDTLYRANDPLEIISTHVKKATLDLITEELTFITSSELWFYNFISSKPQLLTRSTEPVNAFMIRSSIGYGFIGTKDGVDALEIDVRDQQNRYKLLSNSPVWAISVTKNEKTLIALQNGQVYIIPIR